MSFLTTKQRYGWGGPIILSYQIAYSSLSFVLRCLRVKVNSLVSDHPWCTTKLTGGGHEKNQQK